MTKKTIEINSWNTPMTSHKGCSQASSSSKHAAMNTPTVNKAENSEDGKINIQKESVDALRFSRMKDAYAAQAKIV